VATIVDFHKRGLVHWAGSYRLVGGAGLAFSICGKAQAFVDAGDDPNGDDRYDELGGGHEITCDECLRGYIAATIRNKPIPPPSANDEAIAAEATEVSISLGQEGVFEIWPFAS